MYSAGLIGKPDAPVKLLGTGDADRAYTVRGVSLSASARAKIEAAGGKIEGGFKADETGDYDGASYAFSGASYAVMRTRVHVVDVPTYQAWLEQQAAGIQAAQTFVQQANGEQ